ncbi:hypothetical protein COMNV_00753 [Commensalibacter sp. Nvir]|uniref:hypothetical protein n=1 Tax=Commensalibacter sp. Nvir TaxID=3069817 RepID=UPI002D44A5A3|nr:hypothetical protein COMNV_00753 [Commensalibacter sp. Nvir]
MKNILAFFLIASFTITPSTSKNLSYANELAQLPINLVMYEHKANDEYQSVIYLPYYPAYGMVTYKSSTCNAELKGYIDPFALKNNILSITSGKCSLTFKQENQSLIPYKETNDCQSYHSSTCNFLKMNNLKRITFNLNH